MEGENADYYEHRAKVMKLEVEEEQILAHLANVRRELQHQRNLMLQFDGAPGAGPSAPGAEAAASAQAGPSSSGGAAANGDGPPPPPSSTSDEAGEPWCMSKQAQTTREQKQSELPVQQSAAGGLAGASAAGPPPPSTPPRSDAPAAPYDAIPDGATILDTPYKEKDAAKAVGALWDPYQETWYVPPGADLAPFKRWNPATRVYLTCPIWEKNQAKAKGARWDPEAQKWFISGDMDVAPFAKWHDGSAS